MAGGLDPLMLKYNASILYDKFLYKEDILGSIAFARANAKSGIISNDEFAKIKRDIHTANERRLGEIIGKDTAGKLHTGRSRNEQVVCDMRMWFRDQIREIENQLVAFIEVIAARAEAKVGIIMPGYTHLQRAMVVMWSQNLLSFGFNFASDLERLRETLKRNSMNAVADRDFVTEFLQWGSMFMQHISRWAEDLILYSFTELSFVSIAESRWSWAQKGLPSTYNKDLQESWEPMLDHVKTISDSVQIANNLDDYLVRKGIPFHERHHISGRCVAKSEELGAIDSRFIEDVLDTLNYETSVETRSAKGGTSRARVLGQVKVLKAML
ncbi:L-Aspartase-like protein [Xylaria grammica]|nr:L-Aspartase-like protein [Xylaria grammica]